ncbi:MAG: hypothetical protein IJK67_03315, partial [Bacilli bacterium]|nr:hypothetical protein [Bacilli bacterium]
MEKISPEKFSFIRDALRKSWLDFTSAPKNANNVVNLLNEKYIRYEKELLNYDLSDIPFDSWFSIVLIGTENNILDFSKTKANIDFNKVICKGYVNFKGCNLRNVDSLNGYHFPEMFDEDVVKSDNSYFLSDKFDKKFKKKYYSGILDISDLSKLSKEQIIEISKKKYYDKLKKDFNYSFMLQIIPLKNVIELYNNYNKEYETVGKILELFKEEKYNVALNDFIEKVKNMNTNQIKNKCFELVKKCLNSYDNKFLSLPSLPELFQKENSYLYLKNINIPKEVKRRYFERKLTLKDLVRYPNAFNNIVFDYSTDYPLAKIINEKFGPGEFQKLVRNHLDVFNHMVEDNTPLTFTSFFQKDMTDNIEESLAKTVKHYYNFFEPYSNDGNIPNWMSSINFKIIDRISTKEELYGYNEFVIIENDGHQLLIDNMGIENIKKFDEEYGFFTHYERLQLFDLLARSLNNRNRNNFENGTLSYEEFCNIFAAFLDNIRKTGVFSNYNYNWIQGKFRDEHPEIFIDENAPESLKEAFFSQGITADKLFFNKNWIPFLVDKNLSNTINTPINLITSNQSIDNKIDFIKEYSSRHGNKKTLELIAKYGAILSNINIMTDDIESESAVELAIQSAIYNRMISRTMDYRYLESVTDFSSKYPEYFLNLSNSNDSELFKNLSLDTAFYGGYFEYDTIRKYPQLIQILKDKNLFIPFRQRNGEYIDGRIINSRGYSELELILAYGNEKFLELCARYGSYLKNIPKYLYGEVLFIDGKYYRLNNLSKKLEFNDIINIIDDIIAKECKNGNLLYDDDVAPDFLKEKSPELFLSEDAPSELKMRFYSYGHIKLDFYNLQNHKEWLPYLKGKSVKTALIKGSDRPVYFQGYFACFGEELGIELGIKKPETVTYMINSEKINVMWEWYIKTGKKFIPDYVVMNNFSLEEADKFLSSASNWSTLMKIERFAKNSDARDALLKLAYSFGVFDHDQKGLKKLIDLLSYIPRKIDVQDEDVIKKVDSIIDLNSARNSWINPKMPPDYKEKAVNDMIDYMRKMCVSSTITITIGYKELYDLFIAIKNEKVNVDFAKPIFSQIYRKNDDGSYSLTINPQNYPKTAEAIRSTLEKFSELSLMSPSRIHHYIGGFKLEYDPEFREFFLKNYDTIMSDSKYLSQIAIIQRRFKEIKAVYS